MSVKDIEGMVKTLEKAGVAQELIGQIKYAVDYESTVTALEARLRGGYQFQEIISDAMRTTLEFYDADSVLIVGLDTELMIARPEYEVHREGFMPVCGTEPMYLNEYPEILMALSRVGGNLSSFPYMEMSSLLEKGSKEFRRIEQVGIHSIMATPYAKRSTGYVIVINPRRYTECSDENSLLQVLSYVTVSEINEMNLMNCQRSTFFDDNDLMPNDVFVKLLNGFELHTKEGIMREDDIRSNLSVLFLTHLLVKKGASISAKELVKAVWEDTSALGDPEQRLRNLSYSTKTKIIRLFPSNGFLTISASSYSIGRKYNVITDLDWFGYRVRDIQGISDPQKRLDRYLKLLDSFSGVVLPHQSHASLKTIDSLYEEKREEVQRECLALMYELKQYRSMHDFINRITLSKDLNGPFTYWSIKADVGMGRPDLAHELLADNGNKIPAEYREELYGLLGRN